ncbi:hypothetical protein [Vreelandella sedimenti]|uniref:hypothetical protein n=1 Tax=Vreelandella sedimenti TaxID=2729618 RepID=UPI00257EFA2C|nr:hypothetical protein [Halomonas sp. UBA3173]|tara:strand:- start:10629 stop:11012 length:384 start_codon:yes stop_codon:yes gene_type:complete
MLSQIAISLVSLTLGGLVGHYSALGRETRKSRNKVREPIWILVDSSWRKSNGALLPKLPSSEMVNKYRAYVSKNESQILDHTIAELEALKKQCIPNGMGRYTIPPNLKQHADQLVGKFLHTTRLRQW